MRGHYSEPFILSKQIRQIVKALLDTADNSATISLLSEKLDIDANTLYMEIAGQAYKYPAFDFDPNDNRLSLNEKYIPLMKSTRVTFKRLQKSFFVSRRLEGKIFKWAARAYNASDFWDQVQRAIYKADLLSGFLLTNFLGYGNLGFGPLGYSYVNDAVDWATNIPIFAKSQYAGNIRKICVRFDGQKAQDRFSSILINPVFLKDFAARMSINDETLVLLESLGLIVSDSDNIYHFRVPRVFPWDLDKKSIGLYLEEDYCRRINRDLGMELNNPVNSFEAGILIQKLTRSKDGQTFELNINSVVGLQDFCNNVYAIFHSPPDKSKSFQLPITFPISIGDPWAFGEILWALDRVPTIIEIFPFEWLNTLACKAINKTKFISANTGMKIQNENSSIFIESPFVAESVLRCFANFGFKPVVRPSNSGFLLEFSGRDCNRLRLSSGKNSKEVKNGFHDLGFAYEILDEVMRTRPRVGMPLQELANRLGVTYRFLKSFIETNLKMLDLSFPHHISPKEDPFIEIKI